MQLAERLRIAALAGVACLGIWQPVWALRLSQTNSADRRSAIVLSGEIEPGDAERFVHYIHNNFVKPRRSLTAVYLDSGGGMVEEGIRLAEIVHRLDVAVVVGDTAVCQSTCILLLAASTQRVIGVHASLGVHSVAADPDWIGGKIAEDNAAMAKTIEVARLYRRYGVPDRIVVAMLTTLPTSLHKLNQNEMALLRAGRSP